MKLLKLKLTFAEVVLGSAVGAEVDVRSAILLVVVLRLGALVVGSVIGASVVLVVVVVVVEVVVVGLEVALV